MRPAVGAGRRDGGEALIGASDDGSPSLFDRDHGWSQVADSNDEEMSGWISIRQSAAYI